MMDGILLVDKPAGWTSFDVVAKVRGIIKAETGQKIKIGHTGTLDPMATGLLVLVLGKYTKRAGEFSKLDKVYEAELTLGQTSSTGDGEGELTQKSTRRPSLEEVQNVLNKFVGEINQTPPQYSAIKIDGQRAYKAARAGKTVVIEPRQVKIHSIKDVEYEYPILRFTTEVSSGTYIRSLAEDIGQELGTGAYLSSLRRTQVGEFCVADTAQLDKFKSGKAVYDKLIK
jgi:tRNA pseudouridine55 synthase